MLVTGLLLLPMSVTVGAGSLASGRLTARLGARPPMVAGLTLAAAGAGVLATFGTANSLWLLLGGSVLLGSLLGSGHVLSLHVPLAVAAAGYLLALALTWTTIRGGR